MACECQEGATNHDLDGRCESCARPRPRGQCPPCSSPTPGKAALCLTAGAPRAMCTSQGSQSVRACLTHWRESATASPVDACQAKASAALKPQLKLAALLHVCSLTLLLPLGLVFSLSLSWPCLWVSSIHTHFLSTY